MTIYYILYDYILYDYTRVWGITTEKVWNANAIGEFQRRNQVKLSDRKIEYKAGTYGAKCLRIRGKARTEIERGRDMGFNEPLKICDNLNPVGNLVHSLNNSFYIFSRF